MRLNRKHIISLILVFLTLASFAQNRSRLDVQRAEKFFDAYEYVEAARLYEKLVSKDSSFNYAKLQLAESYRKMNDPVKAAKWYSQIINDPVSKPIHKLYLAQALMSTERYDEARDWLEVYKTEADDSERANQLIFGIDNFELFQQESDRFQIDQAAFNSQGSDFSPTFYRDGIVFSSNRDYFKMVKRKHGWDNTNFLQIYYTGLQDSLNSVTPFSNLLNTKYHEGPLTFYDDYEKVIFTRNNYNRRKLGKAEDETIHLQLYLSARSDVNKKWSKPVAFPHNNPEYSVGHPTMAADETTLYFSSDMPGGQGGVDLYRSKFINGQWTKPVNLGSEINTSGDEVFPFVRDSILYFSSDGHYGMGGLDLYQVNLNDTIKSIENLGAPLNSNMDDFGLIIDEENKNGYFTSNRSGGRGSDDIYSFSILKPKKPKKVFVKGIVVDQRSGNPLDSANVILRGIGSTPLQITTQSDGAFEFELDWDNNYRLSASKPDWTTGLDSVSTFDDQLSSDFLTIPIRQLLVIKGNLMNPEDGQPINNALLTFTETTTGEVDSIMTNNEGVLYFIAQPDSEYDVFLQKEGYFNFRTKVSTGSDPAGTIKVDLDMEPIVIGRAIRIENIYFDLNKSDIRPDAAIELDKIVAMMRDNPEIKIELSSHTDSRGGDDYNLALSDRRARSSAAYIVSRGIPQENIVGVGYGEAQLTNRCTNGVQCSAEEHQANRRTEFKVVSYQ